MNTCPRCDPHDSSDATGIDKHAQLTENFCVVCSELRFEKLNKDVNEAQLPLDRVVELRGSYHEEVNQVYDPIHRLPPEVVSSIFIFCLPRLHSLDIFQGVPLSDQIQYADRPVQYLLGSICRYWRQVAWSTSQLWNILWLHMTSNTTMEYNEWLADWLSHSGRLPLYVRMFCDPQIDTLTRESITTIISHLNQYSARFKVLDLNLTREHLSHFGEGDSRLADSILDRLHIERLTTFEDYTFGGDSGDIFIPFKFNLGQKASPSHVSFLHMRLKDIDLNWVNVTYLNAGGVFMDEVVSALQLAPQLQRLQVDISRRRFHPIAPYVSIVTHNSLKVLLIISDYSGETLLLNHLMCPALEKFCCSSGGVCPILPIVSFFRRSNCPLKDLSLSSFDTFEDQQLLALLQLTPLLTHLSLLQYSFPETLFMNLGRTAYFRPDDNEKFLPHLHTCVFGAHSEDTTPSWPTLFSIFPDLETPDNVVRRPLSSIMAIATNYGDQDVACVLDHATLSKILKLVEEGITIEVEDGSGSDLISLSRQFHGM